MKKHREYLYRSKLVKYVKVTALTPAAQEIVSDAVRELVKHPRNGAPKKL